MRSKTIGSATAGNNTGGATADYTSISGWEASIVDVDDETGTIITKVAATDTADITLDAPNTAARAYLLTADSSTYLNAATYAAATTRARMNGNSTFSITLSGSGWTFEKFSITAGASYGLAASSSSGNFTVRRMGFTGMSIAQLSVYGGSITCTLSNSCFFKGAGAGIANLYIGTSGSGGTLNMYHCSIVGGSSGNGLLNFGTAHCYATVAVGAGFGDFSNIGTMNGDYNVSADTTAPGSASTKYLRSVTATDWLTNVTASSEDYAIPAGRQGWWAANKDAINQSGWPADVGTDIVGTTRAAPIDPSAWQTPAAVATLRGSTLSLMGVG